MTVKTLDKYKTILYNQYLEAVIKNNVFNNNKKKGDNR